MDVYETDTALVVQIEVAGVLPEDLNVAVEGDTLAIWGCRREARMPGNKVYYQTGINYGSFLVRLDLPVTVDPEASTAVYEQGFLTVTLPKQSPTVAQARRIQVNISP
jgi:HSP20 family protein